MSPWTDLALTGESLSTRADVDVMIRPDGMRESAATYLAGAGPRHPYASPLYADLHGLPPILIHVGDAEGHRPCWQPGVRSLRDKASCEA